MGTYVHCRNSVDQIVQKLSAYMHAQCQGSSSRRHEESAWFIVDA